MDHAGLLLVMMGRQWADFGESINAKIDWTHFLAGVTQIQSKSLESIVAGRKNLNHCIFLGVPALLSQGTYYKVNVGGQRNPRVW